jgi:hypothetical protein
MIPLTMDVSEAGPKQTAKKKRKKIKKYSKAWWRLYRAKLKRKRVLEARKRALRARRETLAKVRRNKVGDTIAKTTKSNNSKRERSKVNEKDSGVVSPFGDDTPNGWSRRPVVNNEGMEFRVDDDLGKQIGRALLTQVGAAIPNEDDTAKNKSKSLGGVPISALRRTVIDKMIREDGWVVNDYQREIGGKKVFVVVAQSNQGGAVKSRVFYFTEVDGRIYSLATDVPKDFADKLANDTERALTVLHRNSRSTTQEATLR